MPNGPTVCILSHEFWQSRFGGRESIVGETITLNGQPWQVVGITPPRLSAPFTQVQVFAPRVFELGGLTAAQVQAGAGYTQPIARLRDGVTIETARQELDSLSRAYREAFGARLDAANTTVPQSYVAFLVGGITPTFRALLGAVAGVLLIACANVAALFLGRLTSRHKEIAVRQSLGAPRSRVVRQFLVESLVFSSVGGLLGLLVGHERSNRDASVFVLDLATGETKEVDPAPDGRRFAARGARFLGAGDEVVLLSDRGGTGFRWTISW